MKYSGYVVLLVLFFTSCAKKAEQAPPVALGQLASSPPMGWNSWNCYGVTVTEDQVRANADYMARHLKKFGWEYVVVDLGWYLPPTLNTATFKLENPPQNHDINGRLLPDTLKFPSAAKGQGFKPLADYVHSLGLKFGIHIMRGIPWQADSFRLRIKDTDIAGSAVSNQSDTCVWFSSTYGVNMAERGGQEYYNSIVELYASWDVDFIKADDMSYPYHAAEISALQKAIQKCGRPMVLSLSPGAAPIDQSVHLKEHANLWRISPDFWDHWSFLKKQFALCRAWQPYTTQGHWPDADMLPLGKLRVTGPDDYVAKHMGLSMQEITNEYSRFTTDEKYTLMSLWSIFRSPLMMGGNLPENDSLTFALLTNRDVIHLNQESINNKELKEQQGLIVWTADSPADSAKYVALFNTRDEKALLEVAWDEIGQEGKKNVRDLWSQQETVSDTGIHETIPPHGARLFKVY